MWLVVFRSRMFFAGTTGFTAGVSGFLLSPPPLPSSSFSAPPPSSFDSCAAGSRTFG